MGVRSGSGRDGYLRCVGMWVWGGRVGGGMSTQLVQLPQLLAVLCCIWLRAGTAWYEGWLASFVLLDHFMVHCVCGGRMLVCCGHFMQGLLGVQSLMASTWVQVCTVGSTSRLANECITSLAVFQLQQPASPDCACIQSACWHDVD